MSLISLVGCVRLELLLQLDADDELHVDRLSSAVVPEYEDDVDVIVCATQSFLVEVFPLGDGWFDGGCDGSSSLDSSVCSLLFNITTFAVSLNAFVIVNFGIGGSETCFSVNLTPVVGTEFRGESLDELC